MKKSPNHKYKKHREFNYESREINSIKDSINTLEIDAEKELISKKLLNILRKSPSPARHPYPDNSTSPNSLTKLYKKAQLCGISIYNKDKKLKTEDDIIENFKLMLEYILELEKLKPIPIEDEYKIFKINSLSEVAKLFKISNIENKDYTTLYKEINKKLC